MVDFNPDQYIAGNTPQSTATFDPDSYINSNTQMGGLESFGRGLESTVQPIYTGIASAIDQEPFSKESAEQEQLKNKAWQDSPVSYGAGKVGGIAAEAAAAPELLGESTAADVAGNAGISALGSDWSKPKEALENTAVGGALGGVGGKVADLFDDEVAPGLSNSLKDYSNSKAAESLNISPDMRGSMSTDEWNSFGDYARSHGYVGSAKEAPELLQQVQQDEQAYGKMIGDIGDKSDALGLTLNNSEDALIRPLTDKANQFADLTNPDARRLTKAYLGIIDDIDSLGKNPSFSDLQKLKTTYGKLAFNNGAVRETGAAQAYADAYGVLKNGIQNIVKGASTNENLEPQLKSALENYSKLQPIISGLEKTTAMVRGGHTPGGFGMVGRLAGMLPGQDNPKINAATAAGLTAMGHPLWGLGALTSTLQNPAAMSKVASSAAEALPHTGDVLSKLSPFASSIINSNKSPDDEMLDHYKKNYADGGEVMPDPNEPGIQDATKAGYKPYRGK